MIEDPRIEIDHQNWLAIPPDLRDGLATGLSKRQIRRWSLVLQARQIPCRSKKEDQGWQLLVLTQQFADACQELRIYEQLNRNWPPPLPAEAPQQENTQVTIWVLIVLGLFHILTQEQNSLFSRTALDWYLIGNADAGRILNGEWWRLLTALTLHADGLHLAGNVIVGGLFVNRLCRDLGSGLGWGLVLATGVLGNLANALIQPESHHSIGASTAVFGAVGLLACLNMVRFRQQLRHRWPLPVAAALGLLALLGTGGENTDLGAHLFGFGFGIPLGILTGHWLDRHGRPTSLVNRVLAASVGCALLLSWGLAIAQG